MWYRLIMDDIRFIDEKTIKGGPWELTGLGAKRVADYIKRTAKDRA